MDCKEKGSYKGECCCNCKSQREISQTDTHFNYKSKKMEIVREVIGWGCIINMNGELGDGRTKHIEFSYHKHDMCELYYPIGKKE